MDLTELFADEDYRFKMRFERGSFESFFGPTAAAEGLLSQRRHWLEEDPPAYAALLPEGIPLLDETVMLAFQEQTLAPSAVSRFGDTSSPWEKCLALGRLWEPDFLLLKPGEEGAFRLVGGCVCFPSSWSLADKMGHPLEFIHGVVPGLNASLGGQIHTFLNRLKPGLAWGRVNWGLSRSAELNHHPQRRQPRLDASVEPEEVWLRVEHQALVALPQSGGVLFGIRLALHSLVDLKTDPVATRGLARALRSMPNELADYKGLTCARPRLVGWLEA